MGRCLTLTYGKFLREEDREKDIDRGRPDVEIFKKVHKGREREREKRDLISRHGNNDTQKGEWVR